LGFLSFKNLKKPRFLKTHFYSPGRCTRRRQTSANGRDRAKFWQ